MKSRPGRLAFKVTTTNQGPRTQGVGSEQQDKCQTPSTEKEHTQQAGHAHPVLYTEGTHQNTNSMRNILLPSPDTTDIESK